MTIPTTKDVNFRQAKYFTCRTCFYSKHKAGLFYCHKLKMNILFPSYSTCNLIEDNIASFHDYIYQ